MGILPDGRKIVISMAVDVTERKQAEEQIRREKQYIVTLHDSISEAIFNVKMPERVIDYANKSVETVLVQSQSEFYRKK